MHNLLCRVARLLRIDDPAYPMARTVFYELLEVPSSFPDDVKIFQHHQIEITAPTGECLVLIDRSSGNDHAYSARSNSGVTVRLSIRKPTGDYIKVEVGEQTLIAELKAELRILMMGTTVSSCLSAI